MSSWPIKIATDPVHGEYLKTAVKGSDTRRLHCSQQTKESVDLFLRIHQGANTTPFHLEIIDTKKAFDDLQQVYKRWEMEMNTLVAVIQSQHKLLDYNAVCNAFELGQLSEEEFMQESERFCYQPKLTKVEELVAKISCLIKLTGIDFSISELADIFECKQEVVEEVVAKISTGTLNLTK